MNTAARHAEQVFREHGGLMRTGEALAAGIHPRVFYRLRDQGLIERISRGVYRWASFPPLGHPDLVAVATRVPRGVICLLSALSFHEITTQIPHEVYVAVNHKAAIPRIDSPPVRVFRFSEPTFAAGVEEHSIDGVDISIYSAAKTIADCFKFRNTIGTDVAIEALRMAIESGKAKPAEIVHYARVCRVDRTVTPYLEALL
jgi:predicted transcriptional regulator of viral defense system